MQEDNPLMVQPKLIAHFPPHENSTGSAQVGVQLNLKPLSLIALPHHHPQLASQATELIHRKFSLKDAASNIDDLTDSASTDICAKSIAFINDHEDW